MAADACNSLRESDRCERNEFERVADVADDVATSLSLDELSTNETLGTRRITVARCDCVDDCDARRTNAALVDADDDDNGGALGDSVKSRIG